MNGARLLRYCRRRAGLTQRELAVRARVAQPAIARIESGASIPRVDTLAALLLACGWRMGPEPAPNLDLTAIRELRRLTFLERLELAAAEANRLELSGL